MEIYRCQECGEMRYECDLDGKAFECQACKRKPELEQRQIEYEEKQRQKEENKRIFKERMDADADYEFEIDDLCLSTYPCQNCVTYKFSDGFKHTELLGAGAIIPMLRTRDIDLGHFGQYV